MRATAEPFQPLVKAVSLKRNKNKKGQALEEPKRALNHAAVLAQIDIENCLSP